jgi:hypothetical protein
MAEASAKNELLQHWWLNEVEVGALPCRRPDQKREIKKASSNDFEKARKNDYLVKYTAVSKPDLPDS